MSDRRTATGLFPPPDYAHAAVAPAGRTVYTAGAVPLDPDGNLVGAGDPAEQARQVLANLETQLAAADAAPEDVLKTTVYVVAEDSEVLGVVWEVVRASRFAGAASTLLGVSALGYEGQLVEIEAIAALED
jgi:enamine deaminase RidA (YjgF/YER057c/UK114 family)